MQRVDLPPPIPLGNVTGLAGEATLRADYRGLRPARASRVAAALTVRAGLGAAHPAVERARPLFHPARGWVRRAERAVCHWLARDIYPRIPGIQRPYSRQLRQNLVLSEAGVTLHDLPRAFHGLRVLLITDIHAGPFITTDVLGETFARLQSVRPDLILLGGDLVTARLPEIEANASAFRSLRAPHGVYAVLGNHDHYTRDVGRLMSRVEDCGIRMLHNRPVRLTRDGQELSLAGVDDLLLGKPDLARALHGARAPVILLSHNPDLVFDAARHGVALVLSGHTHAGQIRIPGLPVLVRQSRYRLDEGRFRCGPTELIVSRGLGAVALPWRTACPPEAVLITLLPN